MENVLDWAFIHSAGVTKHHILSPLCVSPREILPGMVSKYPRDCGLHSFSVITYVDKEQRVKRGGGRSYHSEVPLSPFLFCCNNFDMSEFGRSG